MKLLEINNNLVDNAVKFSLTGTAIFISFEKINNKLRVSVKNEGIGIKSKKRFTRYCNSLRANFLKFTGTSHKNYLKIHSERHLLDLKKLCVTNPMACTTLSQNLSW
ncbi:ATP-binding protein [Chryseobacterium caseinilyticum]|uniref:Sensor histidine kinase n=1 Tax=Chryseobacterium caseinilyticum TaxID=2771428 RepID=A0ABR8Z9K8_9FLAO|nr:sensor histidine kinase [Chryseobacterium caseinilyticum]